MTIVLLLEKGASPERRSPLVKEESNLHRMSEISQGMKQSSQE